MSRVPNTGMMVLAETGAMRRAIERVEECALALEQAIADLNRMQITVSLQPPPAALGALKNGGSDAGLD